MMPPVKPVRLAPLDLLGLGLLGIRTRRMRAALSALGIAIGIATMVVVTGIPASSQKALSAELTKLGTNVLEATTTKSDQPVSFPPESVAMVARIGPVTATSAVANTHARISRSDRADPNASAGIAVLAAKQNLLGVINGAVRAGTFLTTAGARFPTVVLGTRAAAQLGLPDLVPGQEPPLVLIGTRWFTVVGILAETPLTPDLDRAALVGWEAAQSVLGFDGRPTVIYLTAVESRIEAVRTVLARTIHPDQPSLVQVSKPSDALAAKRATENAFSALLLALAGIALLVGGVGVANTMVISVLERRKEIGLRRALGANRGQIRGQFLTESIALSGLGGLAGVLLGVLATVGWAGWNGMPVEIPPAAVGGGLAGAVVVGMVAGVYPSIRAARLTPTEALATA